MYGESIYALIPKEYVPPSKNLRYRSKHNPMKAPTGSTFINYTTSRQVSNLGGSNEQSMGPHTHQGQVSTFGRKKGSYRPNRTGYRRKYTGSMGGTGIKNMTKRSNALPQVRKVKNYRCPQVPGQGEKPIQGLKSNKNFIVANAVENILQPAKTIPVKRRYINKSNFGKVPKYLQTIKQNITDEYQTIKDMQRMEENQQYKERYTMPQDELDALRMGLKKKWNQVHKQFQAEAHVGFVDTLGKRNRRLMFEAKLQRIEADIKAITYGQVYIDALR